MHPLSGDASFRRYCRIKMGKISYMLMVSPIDKEDTTPFLTTRKWLESHQLNVPSLIAAAPERGLLLLEDFGDETWAIFFQKNMAIEAEKKPMFEDAIRQLHLLQRADPHAIDLPLFDTQRMVNECYLYLDWYLPFVAHYHPTDDEKDAFIAGMMPLLTMIDALPKTAVHLDFHSRNLMLPTTGLPLGVIDFQDAVIGPVTYDLASLLYDCYQDYPESVRKQWSHHFFNQLDASSSSHCPSNPLDWHHALRLTALQRHIKAIGIFARLAYRDGKQQFLHEIPLTRKHLREELPLFQMDGNNVLRLLLQEPN
ncbi:MAG: phosphotransferase [Zetaproteobacteria bacterium]|nr:phosphotransferase [Zetaproteobacteria bacterium]